MQCIPIYRLASIVSSRYLRRHQDKHGSRRSSVTCFVGSHLSSTLHFAKKAAILAACRDWWLTVPFSGDSSADRLILVHCAKFSETWRWSVDVLHTTWPASIHLLGLSNGLDMFSHPQFIMICAYWLCYVKTLRAPPTPPRPTPPGLLPHLEA